MIIYHTKKHMKKSILIIAIVAVVALVISGVIFISNNNSKPVIEIATAENLDAVVTQVYEKANLGLGSLMTNVVDVTDSEAVTFYTGLKSNQNVEHVVVSEPMMSSQAYSFVLVKVSEDADIETMKKEMLDNIDTRKWICVEAEKVYVTNHASLICLVMADEEWAKPVYNSFKEVVQDKVGEELERTAAVAEIPDNQFENSGLPGDAQLDV